MSTLPSYRQATQPVSHTQQVHCTCCPIHGKHGNQTTTAKDEHPVGKPEPEPKGDLRTQLASVLSTRRQDSRPTNLSKRATQLADILLFILKKDYSILDKLESMPFMLHMRAYHIVDDLKPRAFDHYPELREKSLKKRLYDPCEELALPAQDIEKLLMQLVGRVEKGWPYKGQLGRLREKDGLDAMALRMCSDACQVVPVVTKTQEEAERMLGEIDGLSKKTFPSSHPWMEFLPHVVESRGKEGPIDWVAPRQPRMSETGVLQ